MEYVEHLNIDKLDEKEIKEGLKLCFSSKMNLKVQFKYESNSYLYSFEDEIEGKEVKLEVTIKLSKNDKQLDEIKIYTDCKFISEYQLEHYYYKHIFKSLAQYVVYEKEKEYTIRVYQSILHDVGFRGTYKINFPPYTISFKPLFDEKQKNYPVERIIAFDCLVRAQSLNHARSKAINAVKKFAVCLSVLLDVGFTDIYSKYAHFVCKRGENLVTELQQMAFIDNECKTIVKDNMNGLMHLEDYTNSKMLSFLSAHFFDEKGLDNSQIYNYSRENNLNLEKLCLERKPMDNDKKNNYAETIQENASINSLIQVPRAIRKYFKSILLLEDYKRELFLGSCKLYNLAHTFGTYEPTLMISFFVASIECLAKIENLTFSKFMEKYLKEDYEKSFCDYLYGNLRSGLFHSGGSYFGEYDTFLDISLESRFQKRQIQFLKAKKIIRCAYINWINVFLLGEKDKE